MQNFWQDFRYGARSIGRNPGFAILAILALALGIGANTAIFSVVNSVLLRPLSYADPGRLVVILHEGKLPASPADYLDWRQQSHSFEQVAAAQSGGATLTGGERAEQLTAMQVSANLFDALGVPAARGRTFNASEDQPASKHVVVLSYPLWQRRFGGDPGIVGRDIVLNGESYTVTGVMPESFRFAPFWATNVEIWTPLVLDKRLHDRGGRSLRIFARLRDGVALKHAQSEIDVICRRLAEQYPETNTNLTAQVVPLQEKVVANIRPTLFVLLGTVGFVLLIACSNVANLMLVRANGKTKETAVRLALGSSGWRLIRQSLLESLMLSAVGAAVAACIARWGVMGLIASLPAHSLPRLDEVGIDKTALAFTVLIAVATGIFCGIAPALRAFRTELQEALKSGARGSTQGRGEHRTRSVLVACEVALALVLMVGAGLMLRTFEHLQAVDPGFDPSHVLTLEAAAGGKSYPLAADRIRFFEQLRPRLESLAGVQAVSLINHLPIGGDIWTLGIAVEGRPAPRPGQQSGAAYRVVQPGYFAVMKIPVLRGRDFNAHDLSGAVPVVIVNEALAKRDFPGEDPIGRRIRLNNGTWMTIAGVVKNVKQSDWVANPASEIYLPHAQSGAAQFSFMTVVMRAHGDPLALAKAAEDAVRSVDKDVPVARVMTMEQVIGDKLWRGRLAMTLLMLFAGVAITLAALGIYGAISYSVAQRTNEIGIRMALGAGRADVLLMILRQALVVVGSGISIGLLGAWMLTRALGGLLYGVTATDPVTFLAVPVLVVGLSVVACSLPALRAMRVDAVTALRYE
ncbi:MAG TPA: ABC transporter permease [Bryobacteraceae bacterium]